MCGGAIQKATNNSHDGKEEGDLKKHAGPI